MADISKLGTGRAPQITPGPSSVGNKGRTGNVSRTGSPEASAPEASAPGLPKDVVSVSEDGDTVQVSPEGETRLEEDEQGRVIAMPRDSEQDREGSAEAVQEEGQTNSLSPQEERVDSQALQEEEEIILPEYFQEEEEDTAVQENNASREEDGVRRLIRMEEQEEKEEEEEAVEAEATSFVGYTDYELEQMYLKGEITRQDYDQEMASREEEEESFRDQSGAFAREMGAESAALKGNERLLQGMNAAFSPEANQTLNPADRMAMLNVAGGAPEALARRESEQIGIAYN